MTPTHIHEALTEVRDAVEVPPVDRVDFQRRVRTERRRRTAGRVVVAGAAAAAVAAVAGIAGLGAGDERRVDTAAVPEATGGVSESVYFVLDGRLTALDPAGVVHDLQVHAETIVGWTSERVYVLDEESRLLVQTVSYDDEGSLRATFGTEPSPVSGPVQSAALSGDGRYLAWTDLDDVSHRYDLKAGREDLTVPGDADTGAIGVGADGLLLYTPDGLEVRAGGATVPVPVDRGWSGAGSELAFGHVLVNDRDDHARLYDISTGSAELVDTVPGYGVLGPYAERVAVTRDGRLDVWDGGTVREVSGLDARPVQARWADETTLLVETDDDGLWACDIELACTRLPVAGDVALGE